MTQTTTLSPDQPGNNKLDALIAMLGGLRLRDLAGDLPALLEEAQKEGWGQLDLLFELFHREEVRKRQRRFERHLKASELNAAYGLENFDLELAREHGIDPSVVRDLSQCEFVRAHRNLILYGGVGTGKTYLARTLGVEALKRGFKVYSFLTADLLDLLHSKRDSFHFGKLYSRYRDADVVILDDLAYMPYSPEKVEYLFSLVVDRHELKKGSIIVTSNTDVNEWWQFFPSKAMGMAFSDRLLEGAQGLRFSGESIRKPRTKRPPKPQEPDTNGGGDPAEKK
jgi:DNA replication protein DnaC